MKCTLLRTPSWDSLFLYDDNDDDDEREREIKKERERERECGRSGENHFP